STLFPYTTLFRSGNDEAKCFSEAGANRVLVTDRKGTDDALDGFRGVDSVQRGEDEVAGFRGFESDFNGFAIAHFADQDDFGSLAKRGAKSERECGRVAVQLALVNRGLFV